MRNFGVRGGRRRDLLLHEVAAARRGNDVSLGGQLTVGGFDRNLADAEVRSELPLARQARAARKGKVIPVDSAALRELDSLIEMNMAEQDSLLNLLADSLLSDTTAMALPADSVDSLALPRDSIYRLMKGYRDVRIFRSDFQTVCDSIVAISTDSTIHLYIDPVLWNQSNQITSDVMDIFTERQQIKRAEFIGSPMMASQLDTTHYNQVAGKTMTAYFYNNQIYRNDVNGNAQTIYYMQDGEPPEITMMGVIEILYRGQAGGADHLPNRTGLQLLSDGRYPAHAGSLPERL